MAGNEFEVVIRAIGNFIVAVLNATWNLLTFIFHAVVDLICLVLIVVTVVGLPWRLLEEVCVGRCKLFCCRVGEAQNTRREKLRAAAPECLLVAVMDLFTLPFFVVGLCLVVRAPFLLMAPCAMQDNDWRAAPGGENSSVITCSIKLRMYVVMTCGASFLDVFCFLLGLVALSLPPFTRTYGVLYHSAYISFCLPLPSRNCEDYFDPFEHGRWFLFRARRGGYPTCACDVFAKLHGQGSESRGNLAESLLRML